MYTDKQMNEMAKIAYIDFSESYSKLKEQYPGEQGFTIEQLLDAAASDSFYAENNITRGSDGSLIIGHDDDIMTISGDRIKTWKIVDIHDTNEENGFYGCAIETSPGNVVLSFRGSEAGSKDETIDDWVISDTGLAIETPDELTPEHYEVINYMNELDGQGFFDKYNTISTTGHSLGGNLSEFIAMYFFSDHYYEKFIQCANIDGPGVNEIMQLFFQAKYDKMHDKMTLYKASTVGEIFHLTADTFMNVINIKCYNKAYENMPKFLRYMLSQAALHSECYYLYNEDESAVIDSDTFFSTSLGAIFVGIDGLPLPIKEQLFQTIINGADFIIIDKEGGGISFSATNAFIYIFAGATHIIPLNNLMLMLDKEIFNGAIRSATIDTLNLLMNPLENVIPIFNTYFKECINVNLLAANQAKIFLNAFKNGKFTSIKTAFNTLGSYGIQYATENPCVSVDTDALNIYAGRIYNVNNRLAALDSRIKSLYWSFGVRGLWNLINADFIIGDCWRLTKCQNYLNNVADNFERAENEIMNIFNN